MGIIVIIAWMIGLALWGIPALVVGFVIASLPNKFHCIALLVSAGILLAFLMRMHSADGWSKLPGLLYLIVLPVAAIAAIPVGIERAVRRRENS